jgi:hypothetical protein
MLKLTYTSTGATLERSVEPLATALRRRVLLGLRTGEPLLLEPTSISLLVSPSLPALQQLETCITTAPTQAVQLIHKSATQIELQLQGYWLAQSEQVGEGIFYFNLNDDLEDPLVNLWQSTHHDVSCYS